MNAQRIMAIFEKDVKDFMKNTSLIFMPALPIILALLYSQMGGDEEMPLFIIYIVIGTGFAVVTAGGIMMMMAEENEKKTLRGLIMSPASFIDIIVGKSLVSTLFTVVSVGIGLLILGIDPFLNIKAILGLILLFFFFLFLGIGIGLFVKTVGMTTVYLMPIMFLFGFTPMIELLGLNETSIALKIANILPVSQLITMHDSNAWLPLGIVLIWTIAAALFAYVCFIKVKKDD